MRTSVRALSRHYACLRAQIELMPAAEAYVEQWREAMEKHGLLPPYEEYFRDAAHAVRVPILEEGPFAGYLEGCADAWRLPDPARIVQAIVHAHAEQHLIFDKHCRCPLRQLLLPRAQQEDPGEEEQDDPEEDEEEDDDEDDDEEEEDDEERARLDG